jgi:cytochrome d ubiquinol oxidase subunit II
LPALLFGVAVGNVLRGVPVTAQGEWAGSFLGLLNPYAIVVGLVSLTFFTLHGALYLRMKAEGALEARLASWIPKLWVAFVAAYALATVATVFVSPFLFEGAGRNPLFLLLSVAVVASIAAIPLLSRAGKAGTAFVASGTAIATMVLVAAASIYPRLVPSSIDLAYSLTIYNASSSPRTLTTMLVIAAVGVPIVLVYTVWVYWIFRGKVRPGGEGYGAPVRSQRAP